MRIPTTINAGAVAAGINETTGARKILRPKQIAVTTDVSPVRPPLQFGELSTKVVVFEVPKIAPTDVAMASRKHRFIHF
ncbi:hypothetical protein MGH68_02475 [Erysipelothrix sp. D19-032]